MLRPALDVPNPFTTQLVLEVGLASPCGVLTALVREDFTRRPIRSDAAPQRLHHEVRLLMMREVVRDDVARVVVHERCEVQALVATEQEREDVRLPELIRLCALEASRRMLAWPPRLLMLDEPCLVEDATRRCLGHADALEASK